MKLLTLPRDEFVDPKGFLSVFWGFDESVAPERCAKVFVQGACDKNETSISIPFQIASEGKLLILVEVLMWSLYYNFCCRRFLVFFGDNIDFYFQLIKNILVSRWDKKIIHFFITGQKTFSTCIR